MSSLSWEVEGLRQMLGHPMIFFDFGTAREKSLEERRPERDGLWTLMREVMFLGEENFNARKLMRRTLQVTVHLVIPRAQRYDLTKIMPITLI